MRRSILIASALFAAAVLLRGAGLDREPHLKGDEASHVANAGAFAEHGHLGPDNWYHPPLKHLLTYAAIRAAGDGPYGWRCRNVVFGAGTVAVLFLLAEALLGPGFAALTAALLLACDPLHVAFSRTTFEDVPATFFLLLGFLFALRRARGSGAVALLGAAVSFGLAVALRTYAAGPLLATAVALAVVEVRRGRPANVIGTASALGAVPLVAYLAPWVPWFRRGYGFGEWLFLQRWAFVAATSTPAEGYSPVLLALDRPWRWFLAPVGVALPGPGGGEGFQALMNDLPVWALVLPALAALGARAIRERRWDIAAVPAAFAILYVPFLAVPRPIFLYSSLPLLPLGFLAIGDAARRLLGRWAPAFVAAAVAWEMYLYPLATGASVPPAWYAPVLPWLEVFGP